jgi:hypothetical protein
VAVVVEERKVFLGFRPVSGGYDTLGEVISGGSLPHRITSILKYNQIPRVVSSVYLLIHFYFFPKFSCCSKSGHQTQEDLAQIWQQEK